MFKEIGLSIGGMLNGCRSTNGSRSTQWLQLLCYITSIVKGINHSMQVKCTHPTDYDTHTGTRYWTPHRYLAMQFQHI